MLLKWENHRYQLRIKQKAAEMIAKLQQEFESQKQEILDYYKCAAEERNKQQRVAEENI